MGRRLVVVAIGNAEAAAEIDMVDDMAIGPEVPDKAHEALDRGIVGFESGDLAADMHVDAGDQDARQLGGAGIDGAGLGDRNAELVLGLAGGDLLVGLGVDVGIDAQRHARRAALGAGALRQELQFRLGLDVEAQNVLVEGIVDLAHELADAREHDLAGGHAGGTRTAQLTLRDHVHAGSELGEQAQDGKVRVGLYRKADQRGHVGEGAGEHLVVPAQRGGRIAVEGRADRSGNRRQCDIFGMKHAVAIGEMMHGRFVRNQFNRKSIGSLRSGFT